MEIIHYFHAQIKGAQTFEFLLILKRCEAISDKQTKSEKTRAMDQAVVRWPSKYESFSSNDSITKNKF
jgi:hypothetical protein